MKPYGITLLRVTVGLIYLLHAYRQLLLSAPLEAASFLGRATGTGHPELWAFAVIAAHALGGLLLVAGVLTRTAALVNGLLALVLLVRVALPQVTGVGYEYALLLTAATVALLFLGSGPLALHPSK
jgi:putative oxidoreductase